MYQLFIAKFVYSEGVLDIYYNYLQRSSASIVGASKYEASCSTRLSTRWCNTTCPAGLDESSSGYTACACQVIVAEGWLLLCVLLQFDNFGDRLVDVLF